MTSSTIISSMSWCVGRNWSKNAAASTTGAQADSDRRVSKDGREEATVATETTDAAAAAAADELADSVREDSTGDRGGEEVLKTDTTAAEATVAEAPVAATTEIWSVPLGDEPSNEAGGDAARENVATAGAATSPLAGELGRELVGVAVMTACKIDADELIELNIGSADPRGE
jgi:hypothetical protein